MKLLLILLMTIHGMLHLVGFLKGIRLKDFPQIKSHISGIQGVFWFFAHVLLMSAMMLYFSDKPYWWMAGMAGVVLSQTLIVLTWRDTRWGTIINVIVLSASFLAMGQQRWNDNFVQVNKDFHENIRIPGEKGLKATDITELPPTVKQWLSQSGIFNKDKIVSCRIKQSGEMKLNPGDKRWTKVNAEQYFRLTEPGFIWKAEMNYARIFPLVALDEWKEGKGSMQIKPLYLFSIGNSTGNPIDEGSMQRFLAEMVWFPSFANATSIQWIGIDSLNAKAIMNYKGQKAEGTFTFNRKGEFVRFSTMRFKADEEGAQRLPWVVEAKEYTTMNGLRIPTQLEVSWILPEGKFTWFKVQVKEIDYNTPYRFIKPGEIL
jgi:hypothetical protein